MKYYTNTLIKYIKEADKRKEIEKEYFRRKRLEKIRSMKGFSRKEYNSINSE